jgi:hypothetical protein
MDIKKINEDHLTRISLAAYRMLSIYGSILLANTVVELRSAAFGLDSRVDLHDKICRALCGYRELSGLYFADSPDYKVYSELIILFDKWREDVEAFLHTPAEVSLDASVGKYKDSKESIRDYWLNSIHKKCGILIGEHFGKLKQFTLDLLNEWDEDIDPGDVGSDDVGSLCYRFNTAAEVMEHGTADWMCVFTIGSMFNEWNKDLLQFRRDSRETPVDPAQPAPSNDVDKIFSDRVFNLISHYEGRLMGFTNVFLSSWSFIFDTGNVSTGLISSKQRAISSLMEIVDTKYDDYDCLSELWDILKEWLEAVGDVGEEPSALDFLNERAISKGYGSWLSLLSYWTIVSNDDDVRKNAANGINDIALSAITDLLSKTK